MYICSCNATASLRQNALGPSTAATSPLPNLDIARRAKVSGWRSSPKARAGVRMGCGSTHGTWWCWWQVEKWWIFVDMSTESESRRHRQQQQQLTTTNNNNHNHNHNHNHNDINNQWRRFQKLRMYIQHNIHNYLLKVVDHSASHILTNDYGSPQSPLFHGEAGELWEWLVSGHKHWVWNVVLFQEILEELTLAL